MKKKKCCFFSIAYGAKHNIDYLKMMQNSLKKFHPDIPHHLYGDKELGGFIKAHPDNKWRIYPTIGADLSKKYDLVIQIDNDCIVTGNLDHIINDKSYHVGGVLNNNKVDPPLVVQKRNGAILDVKPEYYMNAGFLAIRGERPWKWWLKLCTSYFFKDYRYVEQDMLNIMCLYGDLNVKIFDFSKNWHGLISKGQWHKMVMEGDKIILPKTKDVCGEDKEIKILHWAGGSVPKLNYHVYFQPEVCKRLDYLVSENKNDKSDKIGGKNV